VGHLPAYGGQPFRGGGFNDGFSKLDVTQNLEKVMDAIALARCHLWLALEGFSLSAADPDIQELPAAPCHPLADPLADARWKCVKSSQATAKYLTPRREHCQRHHAPHSKFTPVDTTAP
jgi:hypothetical protein